MRSLRLLTASASAAVLAGAVLGAGLAPAATAVFHQPRLPGLALTNAGWAARNWSGYARTADAPYTAVSGSWVVPSVSASKRATYASQWVGIDGFTNSSLIQTGTETDYYNGSAHNSAWWEILPAAETVIPQITVSPGDVMSATITNGGSGSSWTITIADTTTKRSFNTTQTYTGPGASAEWIEEAPTVGGHIANIAQYSSPDTFDPGTANGGNPGLTAADGGVLIQHGKQVSTPSAPDSDIDGFNMAYGSTAPAPPSS